MRDSTQARKCTVRSAKRRGHANVIRPTAIMAIVTIAAVFKDVEEGK